ncbi:Transcriptional regulator [Xylographa trunciseda]|nr:Transcriptional regulator [Xylographa trunciseda]
MPPLGGKGKKGKEGRQSRSRNTTPSSVASASASVVSAHTAYLDIAISHFNIPSNVLYDDILERHGGSGGIPDPQYLETLANELKALSQLAEARQNACDGGMRKLSDRRKERIEEERELDQANREAEERANLKRAAEEEELDRGRKGGKLKRRKERSTVREERPLTHGAHGVARQDGLSSYVKPPDSSTPNAVASTKKDLSPCKPKRSTASGSSSSLSPASQLQSPTMATHPQAHDSARASPTPSSSSNDSHQPPPAASIPQYQTFGADPSTFDDPTTYHIREVTPNMTDDEKKEIYCVASFPHDDLSDLIAGTPPDKDFSNAKPSNQVNANTFATYLEPYVRPLTEEDMGFLKERGDRVTPFLMPRRGKKNYTEVWAEEDGSISVDTSQPNRDKLPANQPRGSIDQIDDENLSTDQNSTGPLLSRLLSTMRYEHRAPTTEEKEKTNGLTNGAAELNGLQNGDINGENNHDTSIEDRLLPATFFPESASQNWKVPSAKLDYAQVDERLKAELRYIGFLGQDEEPDYDAHYDDEVAQRLRFLQTELKKQSIINGARKARLLQIAQERMAHQEYSTILEDLDAQVQQAYLKRNRSLGKGKKNAKRPGGAGGGSHFVGSSGSAGTAKPGIGDQAKTLMERRKKWIDTIKPVFGEDVTRVRREGETIFDPEMIRALEAAERERYDEEDE